MSVRKHRKIGGRYHWSNCLLFDYEFLLRWMTAGYSSLTDDVLPLLFAPTKIVDFGLKSILQLFSFLKFSISTKIFQLIANQDIQFLLTTVL